jgi:CGNR zinc finger protein/putative stress-induced transcription regulator
VTFSHDTEQSLQAIVDLINTDPDLGGDEGLPDLEALCEFVATHRISGAEDLTERDIVAVRQTRRRFAPFFGLDDVESAAAMANELLAQATVRPRLSTHDDYGWHMHYFAPGASLAEHLVVEGGIALANVIADRELDRLRVCDAPTCRSVLVDLSRNRSKRYCDASTCGNRLHVAAYRERQRTRLLAQQG